MFRLLLPLLLPLRGTLFLDAPPGTGNVLEENPPREVSRILGGSALFPLELPSTKTVARIDWSFRAGSGPEILIAVLTDGKLELQNTSDRLGQRLEMANETTLRIRALEKEDSDVLEALVVFATGEVHDQAFRLSVIEPVPDPQIHHRLASKTAKVCNVTLRCLGSEKGGIEVSWKIGAQLGVLDKDSDRYWVSDNGTDLHLSWWPNSSDSTVTCLLSNPVSQKNVSFDLLSICRREDGGDPGKMWTLGPGGLTILVILVFIMVAHEIYLWKKRPSPKAFFLREPEGRGSPELPYAELQKRRSPPEGDENQDPDLLSPCLPESPTVMLPVTDYATLQPGQERAVQTREIQKFPSRNGTVYAGATERQEPNPNPAGLKSCRRLRGL